MLKKLQNVYLPIDKFQAKVFKNSDLSKRGEWVSNFALSLAGESNDDFAEELLTEAQVSFYKEKVRKWKHYIKNVLCNENEGVIPTENEIYTRCCEEYGDEFVEAVELLESNLKKNKKTRKNPQDAPNGNAGEDCKPRTSCDQFTADGDTREDSLNMTNGRNAVALESGTSANPYGDASHREAEDESTTVSKNMRRVPQNEAPAHGFSGGRAAQGTMSRSPEAAAQSGKVYDQETASGNYQRRAGGHLLPSSSLNRPPARSGAVDVLNLAYAGEFGNVRLTQEQYAQLGIKFGNQQKLNRAIDSLSCQLENGEKNPQNHYAELVKWANYRDDMDERKEEEASKPKMTEMEKSWIAAMKRVEAM